MRRSLIVLALALCLVIPASLIVAGAWKTHANQPVRVDRVNGVTMYVPVSLQEPGISPDFTAMAIDSADSPRVELSDRKFDFGIVEPLQAHRHTFKIRNCGKAPLRLSRLGTTCKCLKLDVRDTVVAPNEIGEIDVVWDALPTQDVFLQRATVQTNDPTDEKLDLVISGQVRHTLAAEPPIVAAPRIKPNQPAQASTTIVSQTWDAFTIDDLHSSLKGLTWDLSPAAAKDLERLKARSGWLLTVNFPDDMPTGRFNETLRFTARPSAEDATGSSSRIAEPVQREIPLEGTVLLRLAVYGKDIQPWGAIEAGTIDPARGYQADYLLKVNDHQADLTTTSIQVSPSFVEANVEPYGSGKPGLYRLHLRIPPSAPAGAYRGERKGKISLSFDHPRIKSLELGLDFVVPKSYDRNRRLSASVGSRLGGS